MKAEQLWASILQEAIQGKLVPQLESEPVVEQIGETPEDVPFDIPEKWKWVFLKSLVQPAKQKKPDRDFIYVDVSSIDNKNHEISNAKFIEAHNAPSRARKVIEDGMVLYATVRPYLKNICIAQQNAIKESIASTAFACMKCKDSLLNKYLLAVLISPLADQYVTSVQKGVAYPAVSDKDFYELLVPLPPTDEQIRICATLDQMKVLINSYEQEQIKLEKLEKEFSGKLKSSILQEAIQGKLVPQLESEPVTPQIGEVPNNLPFNIPEKWRWVFFGNIVECLDRKRVPIKKSDRENMKKEFDYYGATGVIDRVSDYIFDERLLLIGEDGANLLSKTKDNAFFAEGKYWVNNHAHVIRGSTYCSLDYLAIYINAISLSPYVTGSAQPKLTLKNLFSIPVPLPPMMEQDRIVLQVEKLQNQIQMINLLNSKN